MLILRRSVGLPLRPGGMYLFLFASFLVPAQARVSGTVKDESGQPLSAAGVLVTADTDRSHFMCSL
jgi:hypothetical protein